MLIVIGKWSQSTARWAEMMDKSGELELPCVGSLVGWWSLIVNSLLLLKISFNVSQRCCPLSHVVVDHQASWVMICILTRQYQEIAIRVA